MNAFELFYRLHHSEQPLIIGNAWNVQSGKIFQELNFTAIATSSAAVADTLGYPDGEGMPFEDYLFLIKRIKASTTIPLSVDLEAGYGKTVEEIVNRMKTLADIGVAGVNIEDSTVSNSTRRIEDAFKFSKKLTEIMTGLKEENVKLFINVRTDVFLLNVTDALKEALHRARLYETTGVHGLFFPCITQENDIREICSGTTLPVNVMTMPGLPGFQKLKKAGVRRISMGNFPNQFVYGALKKNLPEILKDESFDSLFSQ